MHIVAGLIIVLFVLRLVELHKRQSPVRGDIQAVHTYHLMVGTGTAIVVGALLELYLVRPLFSPLHLLTGVLLYSAAFYLRHCAAKALGAMWSVHVETRAEHQLVQSGPYKYVRHPIYTAAIMEAVAILFLAHAIFSYFLLLPLGYALIQRIKFEERTLKEKFGQRYIEYIAKTPALLPLK